MIGSLRGDLLDKDPAGEVVIEVGGLGYRVTVNPATLAALPDTGHAAFVHVHHHMREDHQQLYGFPTADERRCFESLISAHGVGPALAMAVLATHPPLSLRQAVATEDVDALCLVPDLAAGTPSNPQAGTSVSALADVRDALTGMGFSGEEVAHATEELDGDDVSAMLRVALQRLAAR